MQHFVECVLERRVKSEPENVTYIQSPPNTKERPPKEDIIKKQKSRFTRHTDA